MLTTLAVSGYRSLRDVALDLGALTVVTGANGSGKSNLSRALRLLAAGADGDLVGAVAREGGLASLLWAGPEHGGTQGTVRSGPVAVKLGFASDDLGYLVDLGLPQTDQRSAFARDPEIKREQIFAGPVAKPSTTLIERAGAVARVKEDRWQVLPQPLAPYESIVTDLVAGDTAPELLTIRRTLAGWRFYDHFRVDADTPARRPQIGTRTHTLSHGGDDIAAAWATIQELGHADALDHAVDTAFPGSRVRVDATDGRFRLVMKQHGLLRELDASELSDGTLRYLLLCAALLSARPAPFIVVNEPESSLHPDLLTPLAELIAAASEHTQVLVITHAARVATLLQDAGATTHRLRAGTSGTTIEGQGALDRPAWNWPSR